MKDDDPGVSRRQIRRALERPGFAPHEREAVRAAYLDSGTLADSGTPENAAASYVRALQEMGADLNGPPVLYVDPTDPHKPGHNEYIVCGVCQVPLNRLTSFHGDDDRWLHSRNWQQYDHEPEPVVADRAAGRDTICDFCGLETQLYWGFVGKRVRVHQGDSLNDYGSTWSACEGCSPLVAAVDYAGLSRRAQRHSPSMQGHDAAEKQSLTEAYLVLWQSFIPTVTSRIYLGPKVEPTKLNPRMMPKLQIGLLKFWRHQELLEIGREAMTAHDVSIPGVHTGDEDTFVLRFPAGTELPPAVWTNHAQHLAAGVGVADLYWISENFTRLAVHAGKRFEKLVITREELPSTFGFMVFADPIGEIERPDDTAAVRAVTWTLVPGGVWFNLYIQSDDGIEPDNDIAQIRQEYGYLVCPNAGSGMAFGEEMPTPEPGEPNFFSTVLATLALIRQPGVAGVQTGPVDTKYARSYQRQYRRPLPPVKLIDLRKRPRPDKPKAIATGKQWTERRIVSGHWKRQFYGEKRGMRKWLYIDDYIAGPDDAPLRDPRPVVRVMR